MKPGSKEINYEQLVESALIGVVRDILRHVSKNGLVGESHYYVNFSTSHAGVNIPDFLRERFPQEMTIVLQHQFWDLIVREEDFSVSLSFGGEPHVLTIPFSGLISFADPAREFGLRFALQSEISAALSEAAARALESLTEPTEKGAAQSGEGAKILTLPFGDKNAAKNRGKSDTVTPMKKPTFAAAPRPIPKTDKGPKSEPTSSEDGKVVAFPGNKRKKE